jgi:hypothetical protein
MLKSMKNNELENLGIAIFREQQRRAKKRISEGKFEPLNEEEKLLLMKNKEHAINEYCYRTGCPKTMAEMIVNL